MDPAEPLHCDKVVEGDGELSLGILSVDSFSSCGSCWRSGVVGHEVTQALIKDTVALGFSFLDCGEVEHRSGVRFYAVVFFDDVHHAGPTLGSSFKPPFQVRIT